MPADSGLQRNAACASRLNSRSKEGSSETFRNTLGQFRYVTTGRFVFAGIGLKLAARHETRKPVLAMAEHLCTFSDCAVFERFRKSRPCFEFAMAADSVQEYTGLCAGAGGAKRELLCNSPVSRPRAPERALPTFVSMPASDSRDEPITFGSIAVKSPPVGTGHSNVRHVNEEGSDVRSWP